MTCATPFAHAADINSAARDSGDSLALSEIVVTATKIQLDAQKIPIAVSIVSGADLTQAGVFTPQELGKLVPGLQIEQNGPGSSIYIRGVGSRVLSPLQDPAVAFSVDGVYYSRVTGPSDTFFDLSRVEVVNGPQGILYGRNATGGAVNLITNRPTFDAASVDVSADYGNYNTKRFEAAINAPINDQLAMRVAGQFYKHSGYLSDGYDDADTGAARASLLWRPSADLSVAFSADYAHEGGRGAATVPVGPGGYNNALTTRFAVPGEPFVGPSDPRVNNVVQTASPPSAIPVPFPGTYCVGVPVSATGAPAAAAPGTPAILTCNYPLGVATIEPNGYQDNNYYGANLTTEANLGFAELTAIGGYRGTQVDTLFRVDPTSQLDLTHENQESAEVRLNSLPGKEPLHWLVGAFFLREDQRTSASISTDNSAISNPFPAPGSPLPASTCVAPLQPGGPASPPVPGVCLAQVTAIQSIFNPVNPSLVDQTYAGFGQVIYDVTDWLRLSAGIRYTHEHKTEAPGSITDVYTLPVDTTVSYPTEGEVSFNKLNYRAGVEVDVAEHSMAYASYSTGFHAGGLNFGVPQGPNPYVYQPETVTNYALGIKNRFFEQSLQVNVEAFWLNYDNYQSQSLGRINDGSVACSQLAIIQACPFTLRTDNAATARSRGVQTDVLWRVFAHGTFDANLLYNDAAFTDFIVANPFTGALTNYSGAALPGVNPWTFSTGYNHEIPLANGASLIADVHSELKNGAYLWYVHVPGDYQKFYSRTDLDLGYYAPGKHWSISAYVRNVENSATLLQGSPPETVTNLPWNNLNPPRTYGLTFQAHLTR